MFVLRLASTSPQTLSQSHLDIPFSSGAFLYLFQSYISRQANALNHSSYLVRTVLYCNETLLANCERTEIGNSEPNCRLELRFPAELNFFRTDELRRTAQFGGECQKQYVYSCTRSRFETEKTDCEIQIKYYNKSNRGTNFDLKLTILWEEVDASLTRDKVR